jgi:hypothetical protein
MKSQLAITALVIGALAGTTYAVDAKSYKHHKSSSTSSSSMTTGSGKGAMSPRGAAANPSGQGNVGPGTNNNTGPASGGR